MFKFFKRGSDQPSTTPSSPVRDANLATLKRLGFRVAPSLPVRRDDGPPALRPREEIVKRLAALEALCIYVSAPPDKYPEAPLRQMIADHGLEAFLADEEKAVFALARDEAFTKHGQNIGWRMENMVPLAWALGNSTEPRIDGEMIGGDELDLILTKFSPKSSAELSAMLARSDLRPLDQVIAIADLFYCAHNAVRSAQFNDPKCVPRGFDPVASGGVIHERRHALTWMLSPGVSWDDTDLST